MGKLGATLLGISILAVAPAARADYNLGGCLVGPMDAYTRCYVAGAPAAGMAAVAAPFLVVGAVATIAHELDQHGDGELPPGTVLGNGKQKPSLSYVPAAPSEPLRSEPVKAPSGAFNFNDKASTVATAVTVAALVGAVIAVAAGAGKPSGARH